MSQSAHQPAQTPSTTFEDYRKEEYRLAIVKWKEAKESLRFETNPVPVWEFIWQVQAIRNWLMGSPKFRERVPGEENLLSQAEVKAEDEISLTVINAQSHENVKRELEVLRRMYVQFFISEMQLMVIRDIFEEEGVIVPPTASEEVKF